MSGPAAPRPLAGLRVLEFSHTIMGPCAGMVLADLGAEVVKVEPPEGDTLRAWRTRGVEATVALHAVSNTVVFTYGALGISDPSETEITPEQTIMSSLLTIGVTVLLLWVLREKSSANSVVSASSTA